VPNELEVSNRDKPESADPPGPYAGMKNVTDAGLPHLGGNIHEGDAYTFAPSVWDYLIDRFAVRSVLDLGAGLGYSSRYFHRAGVEVVAVDGLEYNVKHSVFPSMRVDLTLSRVVCRVDLVHCQEVVEHIEEKYLENLLLSLTCGRFIVMTNALPGQGGYHHVNEQPTDYWIGHLKRHGCEVMAEDTKRVRALAAKDGARYLADTGLVLSNQLF
jgi:SAM-dependent methyltransferase